MILKITTTLALLFTLCVVGAQNLNSYKEKITSSSSAAGSSITINEDENAQEALKNIATLPSKSGFLGYRIGIFFDNGPTARAKAEAAKKQFTESFPYEKVYMTYENPYFKVSAGNCATQEEAVILLDKIQKEFPKAYLMREQLLAEDVIISQSAPLIQEEESTQAQ